MPGMSRKLESKINKRLISKSKRPALHDGFKKGKVVNEVLDKPTVMTLYRMIADHTISHVNGAVSAGKESVLFWAAADDGTDIALKVYLVSTSNFKRRMPYIQGDPRFTRLRKGTRNLIRLWARKEFRNLVQCHEGGIAVPRPIRQSNNVLAMSFVGEAGRPAGLLQESEADLEDYRGAIHILRELYGRARLVHGDFSEFNMFKTDAGLVVFDLGSAVDIRHPNAPEFLRRDIYNITRFFSKRGISVEEPETVFGDIVG